MIRDFAPPGPMATSMFLPAPASTITSFLVWISAQDSLGQATGLGANAGQLLQMLAPIVMAFLAQRVSAGGLSADGLGQVLGQEKAQVQQQGGLGGGLLGALLDQDGDGQVGLSDLMKIGGSFLGGRR